MLRTTRKIVVGASALVLLASQPVSALISGSPAGVDPTVAHAATTPTVPLLHTEYVGPITDNAQVFKARIVVMNPDLTPIKDLSAAKVVTLNADGSVATSQDMSFAQVGAVSAGTFDVWIDQAFVLNQFNKTFYIQVTDSNGVSQLVQTGGRSSSYVYPLENGNKVGISKDVTSSLLLLKPIIDISTKFNGLVQEPNPELIKFSFNATYETGETMDNIKVTLKSETTGWSIDLDPNAVLWHNPTNPSEYHLWFDQELLTYGQTYSITVTGPNGASELLYKPDNTTITSTLASGKQVTLRQGEFARLYIDVH